MKQRSQGVQKGTRKNSRSGSSLVGTGQTAPRETTTKLETKLWRFAALSWCFYPSSVKDGNNSVKPPLPDEEAKLKAEVRGTEIHLRWVYPQSGRPNEGHFLREASGRFSSWVAEAWDLRKRSFLWREEGHACDSQVRYPLRTTDPSAHLKYASTVDL